MINRARYLRAPSPHMHHPPAGPNPSFWNLDPALPRAWQCRRQSRWQYPGRCACSSGLQQRGGHFSCARLLKLGVSEVYPIAGRCARGEYWSLSPAGARFQRTEIQRVRRLDVTSLCRSSRCSARARPPGVTRRGCRIAAHNCKPAPRTTGRATPIRSPLDHL